jgi:magnesium transporter
MDVQLIGDTRVVRHRAEDLPALLERGQGLVWVDIPTCDEEAVAVLSEVFGFHPLAIRDCVERNHEAKVHAYPDHVFVVLHAPERGQGGHVHYLELDQFIGPGYLVTVHGPLNPVVHPELALRETRAVLRRVEAGRLHPSSSFELSHAIVSALTRHQGPSSPPWPVRSGCWSSRSWTQASATPSGSWRSCSGPATGWSRSGPWPP